jgi:hypothetical protein
METRYETTRDIHFVEHSQRAKGLLVSATRGFTSPFNASAATVLVPMPPTALPGPVWLNEKPDRDQAMAMVNLPAFRHTDRLHGNGNVVRRRLRADVVWIVSTDPFVLAINSDPPRRPWRAYERLVSKQSFPGDLGPPDNCTARLILDEELDQQVDRLAVLPDNFWSEREAGRGFDAQMEVVTLKHPTSIAELLNTLTRNRPADLGTAEAVALYESFPTELDRAKAMKADQDRLRQQ